VERCKGEFIRDLVVTDVLTFELLEVSVEVILKILFDIIEIINYV
jgi:hypothetical protein